MFELLQMFSKLLGILLGIIILFLFLINAVIYLVSFYLGYKIIEWAGYTAESSLKLFMTSIGLSSLIAFILTVFIFLIFKWRKAEDKDFKIIFTLTYLINTYIWGLLSVVSFLKPSLIEAKVFTETDFFDQSQLSAYGILFFISITNYTLFKNIVFDGIYKDLYNMLRRLKKHM